MKSTTEPIADRIELLVDGELPEGERARLFAEIEANPDGWRHCALAYAEVQVMSESFAPGGAAGVGVQPGRRWWRMGGMAAALVAAFLAGRMIEEAGAAPEAIAVAETGEAGDGEGPAGTGEGAQDTVEVASAGNVFRSSKTEDGAMAYHTLEQLPPFMLEALVAVGHRVRFTERKVQLDAPDGGEIELPLVETEIIDMRPMAL